MILTVEQFRVAVVAAAITVSDKDLKRIVSKVDVRDVPENKRPDLGPCWFWTASKTNEGYPRIGFKYKGSPYSVVFAHRLVYQLTKGVIPDGLELDHLCEVPSCVNPYHLQVSTGAYNTLRSLKIPAAINSRKTHCPKGHALVGDNVIVDKRTKGRNSTRRCRVCKNEYQRRLWKAKQQAA
jgi:hypothetical protein